MTRLLVATDSDEVLDELDAAVGGDSTTIDRVRSGKEVRRAVAVTAPDLVVLDLQIGNMGGMATSLDLRLEESGGRLARQRILLLLDREADEFVARRSGADAWVRKPLDALRLRRAVEELLAAPVASEPA